jgi:hypothetical protein
MEYDQVWAWEEAMHISGTSFARIRTSQPHGAGRPLRLTRPPRQWPPEGQRSVNGPIGIQDLSTYT